MIDALTPFVDAAFRLPTAVFTWMLIPIGLYWMVSLTGLFSLDWLDGVDGAIDGAAEGLAEAAGEALAEGVAEAATEAVAGGAAEALADGAGDAMASALDVDLHPGILEYTSFGDVPRSLSWSLMIGFAWLFSLLGSVYIPGFSTLASRGLVTGAALAGMLGVASFGLAIVATSLALRPVNKAMRAGRGASRHELIGRTCTVRTSRVDKDFGQAEVDDGNMIIEVRGTEKAAKLGYGDKALIFNYDGDREVFLVAPIDRELAP